jgi:hypothetical protein
VLKLRDEPDMVPAFKLVQFIPLKVEEPEIFASTPEILPEDVNDDPEIVVPVIGPELIEPVVTATASKTWV